MNLLLPKLLSGYTKWENDTLYVSLVLNFTRNCEIDM
jgi:hypothetical protein